MELENKQIELLEQFCLLAKNTRGRGTVELINQATSEPGLFAFGELLDLPQIKELHGTEHAPALDLLQLFAFGTLKDLKENASHLSPLQPSQLLKMKQLTVMTLAETAKVLPYDLLMQQLDVKNVRELEDLLINDCMYAGIVRGKLDQRRRCFEVQIAAGRDLRPGQVDSLISTLGAWLATSERLLQTIQDKIKWADTESEKHRRQKKEIEDRAEEMRNLLKSEMDMRSQPELGFGEGGPSGMDFVEDGDESRPKRERRLASLAISESRRDLGY